jgi:hypothetical protein
LAAALHFKRFKAGDDRSRMLHLLAISSGSEMSADALSHMDKSNSAAKSAMPSASISRVHGELNVMLAACRAREMPPHDCDVSLKGDCPRKNRRNEPLSESEFGHAE